MTAHLDLGCGPIPRNPYRRERVFGVDIAPQAPSAAATVVTANLALERIPFDDASFESVSAYDFLEHIPRVLPTADGKATRNAFIEVMNEISRVLKPGGLLYALTPAYPSPEAFADPTHVNILTDRSHLYFTGPQPLGRMYGFSGHFTLRRAEWVVYKDGVDPLARLNLAQRWRHTRYRLQRKLGYLAWEFERSAEPLSA